MSNKIENENELWDKLNQPTTEAPKSEGKPTVKISGTKAATAPKNPKPVKAEKPKGRFDGFFFGCMVGVAAVSVAATLAFTGFFGGQQSSNPGASNVPNNPGSPVETGGYVSGDTVLQEDYDALARENEALQQQLEIQREQIKNLQNDLMEIMGSDEYLSQMATDPNAGNEVLDNQKQALSLLTQIQEAYAEFDRAKLEELIPQMDALLAYLPSEALNDYYLILEYVEQPSNG